LQEENAADLLEAIRRPELPDLAKSASREEQRADAAEEQLPSSKRNYKSRFCKKRKREMEKQKGRGKNVSLPQFAQNKNIFFLLFLEDLIRRNFSFVRGALWIIL
jgi:hypothetical protein